MLIISLLFTIIWGLITVAFIPEKWRYLMGFAGGATAIFIQTLALFSPVNSAQVKTTYFITYIAYGENCSQPRSMYSTITGPVTDKVIREWQEFAREVKDGNACVATKFLFINNFIPMK